MSAWLIGEGYKLFYVGDSSGRNGVGVVLNESMWKGVVGIRRKSSRLMLVELVFEGERVSVVSAYAPQIGCSREEKEKFWEEFDEVIRECERGGRIVVGGDLNGHVGTRSDGYAEVHGGNGFGQRNAEGEAILDAGVTHDLVVCNTMFRKRTQHLVTFEAGQGK